jgi:nucleotide-binding universal stress UspA family protein
MRILLGVDGSPSAELAASLVGNLPWPAGSVIDVVSAYRVAPDYLAMSGPMSLAAVGRLGVPGPVSDLEEPSVTEKAAAEAKRFVGKVARRLGDRGLTIESHVVCDRAPNAILGRAREVDADLIVLGSRGHGPFESALLGSVSAEVVDHSSRPVLVARRDRADRILVGDDGSASAAMARAALRRLTALHGGRVRILSVADIDPVWRVSPEGATAEQILDPADAYDSGMAAVREEHEGIAARAAMRLRAEGLEAESAVVDGNPAQKLVEAAAEWGADLLVIGTRGRTGFRRLLLGSVARSVLQHAPCSVLVVPKRRRRRAAKPAGGA